MRRIDRTWMTCCFALAVVSTNLNTASAVPPAGWAPKDTLFYMETTNFEELRSRFRKTLFGQLMKDEQFKKLVEPLTRKMDEKMKEMTSELGLESVEDLKVWPEGPAALVVLSDKASPGGEPPVKMALVGDWGKNHGKLQRLFERASAKVVEEGGRRDSADVLGVKITQLEFPKKSEPSPEEGQDQDSGETRKTPTASDNEFGKAFEDKVAFASIDKLAVVGSDIPTVQRILRQVRGKAGGSLLDETDFKGLQRHCKPLGQVNMYLNYTKLNEMTSALDENAAKLNKALGQEAFRGMVATVDVAPANGAALEMRSFQSVSGPRKGLIKLVTEHVEHKPVTENHGFPADTVLCGWANIKAEHLLDTIYEIVEGIDPSEIENVKASMQVPTPDGQTLNMEEVLRSFASPLKGYLSMSQPFQRENVSMLLSIGHSSREKVGKIFDVVGPMLMKRDFMGQSVYEVAMMPIGVAFALTESRFALGSTPGVENMIRQDGAKSGAALHSSAQFTRSARLAPKEAWYGGFINLAPLYDAALSLHNKAGEAQDADNAPAFGFDVTDGLLDILKKIPFDEVENPSAFKKYMFSMLYSAHNTREGMAGYLNIMPPVTK